MTGEKATSGSPPPVRRRARRITAEGPTHPHARGALAHVSLMSMRSRARPHAPASLAHLLLLHFMVMTSGVEDNMVSSLGGFRLFCLAFVFTFAGVMTHIATLQFFSGLLEQQEVNDPSGQDLLQPRFALLRGATSIGHHHRNRADPRWTRSGTPR